MHKANVKHLIFLLTLLIWSVVAVLYYVLFQLDAANAPLSPHLQPDAFSQSFIPRPPVVVISYADGPVVAFKNQQFLAASMVEKGADRVYNYRRGHIDPDFYQQPRTMVVDPKNTLWKAYFIHQTLKTLPKDAVLIYADPGLVCAQSLDPLLVFAAKHPIIIALEGDLMILKNTPKIRAQVEKWLFDAVPLPSAIRMQADELEQHYGITQTERHDATLSPWMQLSGLPSWLANALWNNPFMRLVRFLEE
jgi:hypothetical protein